VGNVQVAKMLKVLRPTECSNCHRKDLRWIQFEDVKGTEHFGLVPDKGNQDVNAQDLTEVDHPLTANGCNLRMAKQKAGETVTVEKEVVRTETVVEYRDAPASVDLTEVNTKLADHAQRLEHTEAYLPVLEKRVTDLTPAIEAIGEYMTTEHAEMRAEIAQFAKSRPIHIVVKDTRGKVLKNIELGRQHNQMANLIAIVNAVCERGAVVFLVGEAGSAKTSAIKTLGKALGMEVLPRVMGEDMSATDIFGFIDANGRPVDPLGFEKFFSGGGITFMDEIGNASASGLTAANSIISYDAGDMVAFAGGRLVPKHPKAYYVAADNTYGRGADALYISRQQLDAATLSRFVYLPWQTDWNMMAESLGLDPVRDDFKTFPAPGAPRPRDSAEVKGWSRFVKTAYDGVAEIGIRAVVSARAMINGAAMLEAGIDRELVEFSTVWAHMSEQDAKSVREWMALRESRGEDNG
jgi:energy-coupling factor transporter ATP-binding protein EcfA2